MRASVGPYANPKQLLIAIHVLLLQMLCTPLRPGRRWQRRQRVNQIAGIGLYYPYLAIQSPSLGCNVPLRGVRGVRGCGVGRQ